MAVFLWKQLTCFKSWILLLFNFFIFSNVKKKTGLDYCFQISAADPQGPSSHRVLLYHCGFSWTPVYHWMPKRAATCWLSLASFSMFPLQLSFFTIFQLMILETETPFSSLIIHDYLYLMMLSLPKAKNVWFFVFCFKIPSAVCRLFKYIQIGWCWKWILIRSWIRYKINAKYLKIKGGYLASWIDLLSGVIYSGCLSQEGAFITKTYADIWLRTCLPFETIPWFATNHKGFQEKKKKHINSLSCEILLAFMKNTTVNQVIVGLTYEWTVY